MSNATATFIIAIIVVIGSFAYLLIRGGSDAVVTPILAGSLGTVLSFFFAHSIANGAADKSLNALIQSNASQNEAVRQAVNSTTPSPNVTSDVIGDGAKSSPPKA